MISKTKINKKWKRKTNSDLVETILEVKKRGLLPLANLISRPRRKMISKNLDEIDKESKEGDTIIVPGKVLGNGDLTKKIKIAALYFSESARTKIKEKKCVETSILEEVKSNQKLEGVKVLR